MRLNSKDHPLDGKQAEDFRHALHDAFFRRESFAEFLRIQLNKWLGDLTSDGDYMQQLLNVVDKADEEGWSAELLQGACLWRPTNVALAMYAQQFGLMPASSISEAFESKILRHHPEIDVSYWCTRLIELIPKICRIDFPYKNASKLGTGFLLGKDMVMTNFHVMEEVFKGLVDPTSVSLYFDYRVLEDGRTLHPGVVYHLPAKSWWRDMSEYSPFDGRVNSGQSLPEIDQLDYILLRLEGNPGLEHVGGSANKNPHRQQRGWINIPSPPPVPAPGTELFILHHPDGKRLKITLNTTSVHSVNSNCTRMRHQTDTAGGTSGAPCFNFNWDLVALHQAGDPAADKNHPAELNQSIPFAIIWKRLERRSMLRYLGDGQQGGQTRASPLLVEEEVPDQSITQSEELKNAQDSANLLDEQSPPENESGAVDADKLSPPEAQPESDTAHDELPPIEQARICLTEAQQYLLKAMVPFTNSHVYILPKQFDESIRFLEKTHDTVQNLKRLLESNSSVLGTIKDHAGDVYHQLNTIFTQIEEHLIPSFRARVRGNFSQLKSALDKVIYYFSKKE